MVAAAVAALINFAAMYYQSIIVVTIAVIIMMKASRNCFAGRLCRHRHHFRRYFAAIVSCFTLYCPYSNIGSDIVEAD